MPDWDPEANDLFLRAIEIPAPEDRGRLLDEACAGRPALRARVDGLIRAGEQAGSFLEHPALDSGPTSARSPGTSRGTAAAPPGAGTVVGRYKLVQEIGEGGMGTVYLAQQTEPVRRLVAVKLIKPGMDSRQVLARFEAERQALALMDHPNIAKVLDAGASAEGRPYFVMELVKGVPITGYCDDHRLGVRERLALFADVCRAVQHAHQKGVIHRDLKPNNVLVAPYDGKPVVKVIDFGVAKATGQALTDKTLFTGLGAVVGTPEYMSPEQAELNNLDIDTRSDVYALGVLLYELLTGTTPLTHLRVKQVALLEVLRVIREEETPRPSARLSSADGLPSIAAVRGVEPAGLSRLVRGELDWIVMKALEKDRNRRYETANGLGHDVERYLNDEAVLACPPSGWYRFRKFARRRKSALVLASLVAVALVGLAGGIGWVARDRSVRQAVIREGVIASLKEARDDQDHGRWPEALAAARRAEALLATGAANEDLRRGVRERLADAQVVLVIDRVRTSSTDGYSNFEQEARGYERAFREYGIDVDALDPREAAARIRASAVRHELAGILLTWSYARQWLRSREPLKHGGLDWKRLLEIARLADPDPWRNRLRLALAQHDRKALKELAADDAEFPAQPAYTLERLGDALLSHGGATLEAEVFLRKVHELHPEDFWITYRLAGTAGRLQPGERMRLFTAAVALRPRNLGARSDLGHTFANAGRWNEAVAQYREAVRLREDDADLRDSLAGALFRLGRKEEAVVEYRQALRLRPDHAAARQGLDRALRVMGKPWEAGDNKGTDAGAQRHPDSPAVANASSALELNPKDVDAWISRGRAYMALLRYEKAVDDFSRAIELKPTTWPSLWVWQYRGNAYLALRQYEKAVIDYSKMIELYPVGPELWMLRGKAFARMGQQDKALADYARAVEVHPKDASTRARRGAAYIDMGRFPEALADYRKALALAQSPADGASVQNELARLLATCPEPGLRDFPEAVKLAQEATKRVPGFFWNTLGMAHLRNGDAKAAVAALDEALESLNGGNAASMFLLALAHDKLGHHDEARAWYDKAVAWQEANGPLLETDQALAEDVRRFRSEAEDALKLKPR